MVGGGPMVYGVRKVAVHKRAPHFCDESPWTARMAQDELDPVEDLVERLRFDPVAEILTEGPKVCPPVIERANVELNVCGLEDLCPFATDPRPVEARAVCGY